jgi:hypothetical protein
MAKPGEQFYTDAVGKRAHPSRIRPSFLKMTPRRNTRGRMESAMHDSPCYRRPAQQACEPYYRSLHLSMAVSWLLLGRRDEAIERLFQGTGYKLALRREDRAA